MQKLTHNKAMKDNTQFQQLKSSSALSFYKYETIKDISCTQNPF